MTTEISRTCLAIVFAATLAITAVEPAHASGPCSLARAAGNYSFTDNGTVIGVGPRTAVGTFRLDMAGNITNGTATSSLNGAVAAETFSGTYTVNPDCTGSGSAQISASGTVILALTMDLAFDAGMTEMRAIFTSLTLEPSGAPLQSVINLEARKH